MFGIQMVTVLDLSGHPFDLMKTTAILILRMSPVINILTRARYSIGCISESSCACRGPVIDKDPTTIERSLLGTKLKTSNDIFAGNGMILSVHEYCVVLFV